VNTQDVDHAEQAPPPAPKTPHTDEEGDDAGSDQEVTGPVGPAAGDPYSNLDGAFGNYMADEPRPMAASSRAGRPNDDDDLLF